MSRKEFNIPETSFDSNSSERHATEALTAAAGGNIRLVLAGQHPVTLYGLSQVVEKQGDCTVLAVCRDLDEILESVRRHQPDLLIVDLDRDAAFKVLRRVQRARVSARVVVLAAASDDNEAADAVRLGACAVVPKELAADELVACFRKVHMGERAPDDRGAARFVSKLFKPAPSMRHAARQLTPREAEIARLAVLGISTREIAARLDVKQGTVKIHLHSIYEKLNVGGRLGLVLVARRYGLT